MVDPVELTDVATLDPVTRAAVAGLLGRAAETDGRPPLNEAAWLRLAHPRPGVLHLIARRGGRIVGYAQLEDAATESVGQLVVDPAERRTGIGTALARALLRHAALPLRVWAVGDSAPARALAERVGLRRERVLLVMTRPLSDPLPVPVPPPGVAIRTFVPGRDEDAWLAVNAAAFAHHPEQGRLDRSDLAERMAEPWFDPAGFFLAQAGGTVVGFHWTKRHPAALGEVYVLGVAPDQGGQGLGKALLLTGLRHLRDAGDERVELYVEADHQAAVGLYRAYGFDASSRDVMYASG